ncbi:MAG: GGDEF domain-containing protein [Terriglobales bacterium]
METPVPAEKSRFHRFVGFASLHKPNFVAALFAGLMAFQAVALLAMGTNRAGRSVSLLTLVAHNVLAIACAWIMFRRARGVAALFWFLFAISLLILLIPQAVGAYDTAFAQSTLSESTWRVLFCLYGAPILMMLFLPETDRQRLKSEVFLDLFQVAIVVGLAFTSLFLLPVQQMLPNDAFVRNISVSNLESIFLLAAVSVRLLFARNLATRGLLLRLGFFLVFCAVVTYIGNWIDLHHYTTASAWFDLGWALPYVAAGLVTLTWTAPAELPVPRTPASFLSYLGSNVVLIALLFFTNLLMARWKQAHGGLLTNVVVAVSLLAFTIRLALTQFGQQREITQRKRAQEKLFVANETITNLLEDARLEVSAIGQINELGNLLQTSDSREEAFRAIPERMARLLPGTSGQLSVLNAGRNRAEAAAAWGSPSPPSNNPPGTVLSQSEGFSVNIPLVANGEALGVLVIQSGGQTAETSQSSLGDERGRYHQLALAAADQIALTIANLDLREALRAQATRDPVTGLYNRRYMQEFLEREIHRARRRGRPLAVMLLDIDHFKRYNDTFGHAAGDEALRFVAEALLFSVRAEDLAVRYGGEEFVILLPECTLQQAAIRAEEIRKRLKELYIARPGELPGPVSASIGVAAFPATTDQVELLLNCADDALYQAKHAGRDRVAVAQPAARAASPKQ